LGCSEYRKGFIKGAAIAGISATVPLSDRGKRHQKTDAVLGFRLPRSHVVDAQMTHDVLVSLEEAFIAAYTVGVRRCSTVDLQTTAARILGVEAEHRVLAQLSHRKSSRASAGQSKN
jgi:hypothetical protein